MSAFVGEGIDAVIIGVIITASVGLGFVNEYRAERAAEAMHDEIRHIVVSPVMASRRRGGHPSGAGRRRAARCRRDRARRRPVVERQRPGMRRIDPHRRVGPGREVRRVRWGAARRSPTCRRVCSWAPSSTRFDRRGGRRHRRFTQFGRIAVGLGERHPQTEFQRGLTRFSGLLAKVAGVLSVTIFVVNIRWVDR